MKLFLASSLDKTLPLLLGKMEKPTPKLKVLFIANASDPFKNAPWVDLDRNAFANAGCQITETDLRNTSKEELAQQIENADILHICGGSVLYLLSLLRRTGIYEMILNVVKQEKILYTGTSAGSILAGPSVQLYSYDEEERQVAGDLQDFSGFGFVNFLVVPHINNPEHFKNTKDLLQHLPEEHFPTLLLHDTQAVWVEDGKFEIVSVK